VSMSERGDQLQKLLGVLARHSDLVAQAFDGSVSVGDRQRNPGIEALFAIGALKPYDEDIYRLNPRLREYFTDYFSSYHAFQALRRVSGTMQQAQEQWHELRRLKRSHGTVREQDKMYAALDESIVDIAYSIERNLRMLHSLLSTQYGNVENLMSKMRQNRYYSRQVVQFLHDVEEISAFVDRAEEETTESGMHEVRHLVTRRLGARRLSWISQIKDAQAVISGRLFEAKLMEARLKRLSRFALWLTQNQTVGGWDLFIEKDIPMSVVRPVGITLRPQPDVADTDATTSERLLLAVSKLPDPKGVVVAAPKNEAPQILIEDDDAQIVEVEDPVQKCLRELARHVTQREEPVSLIGWKRAYPEIADFSDDAWLMFSSLQLKGVGLRLNFSVVADDEPFAVNEGFYDIEVSKPKGRAH